MRKAVLLAMTAAAGALAGCEANGRYPVEATRFHFDPVADRGAIVVEPLDTTQPSGPEFTAYAGAVRAELLRIGYQDPQPTAPAPYRASVAFTRQLQPLGPRRSPVSIGLGGGGFSGGRGGGVGLGGGVSFPVGGARGRDGVVTQLSVRIRRGPDSVWEGQARTVSDPRAPDGTADAVARRLAAALFAGFPGESGRTIEVK